jgi:ssDNA-binding Zn-finger/Zn-ribbon topoisomerase 1
MAAAPKENMGKMPCPCCGDPVALKKSATGKLSYQCQDAECESTGFADQHSGAARKWLAALTPAKQEPTKTTPAPVKAPNPVPVVPPPKKTAPAGAFDLLGLK